MAQILQIPLAAGSRARFSVRTRLDGKPYRIAFRWSQYEGRWYLDLYTDGGTLLAGSVKLVPNRDLLEYRRVSGDLPPGRLFLGDTRGEVFDPTLDELGDTVPLYYLEAA